MRSIKPYFAGVAVLVGALMLFESCSPVTTPDPPAPSTNITISGNGGTINIGNGNGGTTPPSPSASPQATLACADLVAFRSSFGWTGPSTSTRPLNQAQPYPLCTSCGSLLTATLKGPQGDLPLTVASGKGRPVWSVSPVGVLDIDSSVEATNNPDGYNLAVKPVGGVGAEATVHVVINALCVGEPPAGDFKYVITPQ